MTIIVHLEEQKVGGRETWLVGFFCTIHIAQVLACHLCARGTYVGIYRAMGLNDNAKQAIGEGKSGPVESGLNELAAMALHTVHMLSLTCMSLCYT